MLMGATISDASDFATPETAGLVPTPFADANARLNVGAMLMPPT